MIVEFLGLPGTGKTTVKGALIRSNTAFLDQRYIFFEKNLPFLLLKLLQRITLSKSGQMSNLGKFLQIFFKYKKLKATNISSGAFPIVMEKELVGGLEKMNASKLFLIIESFVAYELAKCSRHIVLFDEGVAQRGVTLVRSDSELLTLEKYYDLAPKPDVLFVFNVSDEARKKRILSRDKGDEYFLQKHKEMKSAIDTCVDVYQKLGVRIVMMDGEKAIEDNADAIESILLEC